MKKLTLILTFICIIFNAHAQENSLLWKIFGNGLSAPSYVFGTMHILCDGEITDRPRLQEAFSNSGITFSLTYTLFGTLPNYSLLHVNTV